MRHFIVILFLTIPLILLAQGDQFFKRAEHEASQGEHEKSIPLFQEALEQYQLEDNKEGVIRSHLKLAFAFVSQMNIDKSLSHYQIANDLNIGNKWPELKIESTDALSATYLLTGQPEKAIPYAKACIELVKQESDDYYYSEKVMELGALYLKVGKLDSAGLLINEAIALKEEIKDESGKIIALNYLSSFYRSIGDYENAQKCNFANLEYWQSQNDTIKLITTYKHISDLFILLNDYIKGEEYAKQAFDLAEKAGSVFNMAYVKQNIADLNIRNGKTALGLAQYLEIIETYKISGHRTRLVKTMLKASELYIDNNDFITANQLLDEAKELSKDTEDKDTHLQLAIFQATVDIQQGAYQNARVELENAIEASLSSGIKSTLKESGKLLSEIYEYLQMPNQALKWFKFYSELQDSILHNNQQQAIYELDTRYQVKQKQEEIALLNTTNQLSELKLKSARKFQIMLGIGFLGLLLLSLLIFKFYQTKKRDNELLKEKNLLIAQSLSENKSLMREIHHRVKNNLQIVSSLLNMQTFNLEDKEAVAAIKQSENRVRTMSLMHDSLFQDASRNNHSSSENLETLIQKLFNSYNTRSDGVSLITNIENIELDSDMIISIGIILNELISNALKYAFVDQEKGQISVDFSLKEQKFELTFSDNGVGLPKDYRSKRTLGYQIIEDFTNKLKAKLYVESSGGSSIKLIIPKKSQL